VYVSAEKAARAGDVDQVDSHGGGCRRRWSARWRPVPGGGFGL